LLPAQKKEALIIPVLKIRLGIPNQEAFSGFVLFFQESFG
jgi:hypothetical protein